MNRTDRSSPSALGAFTELAVASALAATRRPVFVPLLNAHSRTDLIYIADEGPRRVQCKSARLHDGYISFWTCSNTGGVRKTYVADVDDFGVYCVETALVYLVPVDHVPSRAARLRVAPTKSNQSVGIRWAEPYLVGRP